MLRYLMVLSLFPVFASANVIGIGKICAGPAMDQYGELVTSMRNVAERRADEHALRLCYPYQTQRVSEYRYSNTNPDCHSQNRYVIKETVEADYTCAQP